MKNLDYVCQTAEYTVCINYQEKEILKQMWGTYRDSDNSPHFGLTFDHQGYEVCIFGGNDIVSHRKYTQIFATERWIQFEFPREMYWDIIEKLLPLRDYIPISISFSKQIAWIGYEDEESIHSQILFEEYPIVFSQEKDK